MSELEKLKKHVLKNMDDCAQYLASNGYTSIDDARFMSGQWAALRSVSYWIDDLMKSNRESDDG